jgi:hypothetical protein
MLGEDGEPDVVDEVGKPEVGDADEPGGVVRALGAVTFPSSLNHNNGPKQRATTTGQNFGQRKTGCNPRRNASGHRRRGSGV